MSMFDEVPGGARRLSWLAAFAITAAIAAVPSLGANTKPKPTEVPARVIAHLPLTTRAGNEMVLQRQGDNHFLYIQMASKEGFMVVNVNKPEFPTLLDRQVKGSDPTAGNLEMVGSDLGVAAVPEKTPSNIIRSTSSPSETVNILDLSDPQHPKLIQSFKNVTGIIGDGGRGILFLANDEGLWVLKHERRLFVPEKEKKPCDSYSAIAAMPPDCQ